MRRLGSAGMSSCSSSMSGETPGGEARDQRGRPGVGENGGDPEHEQRGENPLRVRRASKHLQNLADPGLGAEQLGHGFEAPGARERNAKAAQNLRYRPWDQNVAKHPATPGAEGERVVLIDRIE